MSTWETNESTTVLAQIIENQKIAISQIKVHTNDGNVYYCDDVARFEKFPIPFFSCDLHGNIAFYVTHEKTHDSQEYKEDETIEKNGCGVFLTYISVDNIKLVKFRIMDA